jgi:hypothetical protein
MVPSCMMHTLQQPCDQWYCAFYQDQLVLPVFNIYQWAVKWMGCEPMTLTLARALLVRLWVLLLFVDKYVPSICCTFECYWPARSFSRVPRGYASLLCQWVLLYGWLPLMWCSLKMSSLLGRYDFPRCYRPIPLSCLVVPTDVILLRSHRVWVSDRVVTRHKSRAWYWRWTITMWVDDGVSMILRGTAAPPIIARPLDIRKYLQL